MRGSCDQPYKQGLHAAADGQSCLWWSQGCSIGCDYCATDPRHEANGGEIPTREIEGGWPHTDKAGFRTAYCDEPGQDVLPKEYWTCALPPRSTNLRARVCGSARKPEVPASRLVRAG